MTQKNKDVSQTVVGQAPASPRAPRQPHSVSAEEAGQRIDNFLLNRYKGVPRSHVYRLLRSGQVRVNSKRVEATCRLQEGDVLRLPPVRQAERKVPRVPDEFVATVERAVIYEDDSLMVLDKPVGMAVHAGSGVLYGVIEALRQRHPEWPGLALAHRLDRETSGVLVLAKNRTMLNHLNQVFRERLADKRYYALVVGTWPTRLEQVSSKLSKNQVRAGERKVVSNRDGKESISNFEVRQMFGNLATLMTVTIETGRTHQIRVHTQEAGYPIAGDDKYGDRETNKVLRDYGLRRMFLHAAELDLPLPQGRREFRAPLPIDLAKVLERLPQRMPSRR